MKIKLHDAGAFGPEHAGKMVGGYDLPADDPRLPREIPGYVFRKDILSGLTFVWGREHRRQPHQARMGVLLTGPKGSGKTTAVEQFFQRLRVPVFHYTANRATEITDLLESRTLIDGSIVPVEGPLLIAMRTGCPFVLNELDLCDPAMLTGLNDIIERGIAATSSGIVEAKNGFIFCATTNGVGDESGGYAGTNVMNEALLSRFGMKLRVEYPTAAEEEEILRTIAGVPGFVAKKIVEAGGLFRSAEALAATVSTRELIAWAEIMTAFGGTGDGDTAIRTVDLAIGNGTDSASREALRQMTQRVFGGALPT